MTTIWNCITKFTCYLVRVSLSRRDGRRGNEMSDWCGKTTPVGPEPPAYVIREGKDIKRGFPKYNHRGEE